MSNLAYPKIMQKDSSLKLIIMKVIQCIKPINISAFTMSFFTSVIYSRTMNFLFLEILAELSVHIKIIKKIQILFIIA